jgi:hypothetical protein
MSTMLALFSLGSCSLGAFWLNNMAWAFVLLLIGYSTIFILDPIAADAGEAPLYFRILKAPPDADHYVRPDHCHRDGSARVDLERRGN